jgi:hypothetical protein
MPSQNEVEIRIKLLTGEPPRIRIAKIPHRDLQAILIPREKLLSQAVKHNEWNQSAVYLLLGKSKEDATRLVYIGQTDTAWERLTNHYHRKKLWDTAIVIESQTERFSLDDIHLLEWHCIQKAKEIGQFRLDAQREPDKPHSIKPSMDELFNDLCLLVSVLGYAVFEPEEDVGFSVTEPPAEAFYCHGKEANATGALVADGFVVRKNSIAKLHIAPASLKAIEPTQKKLRDCGVLVEENGHLRFTRDHVFKSVSGAARIVLGCAISGWIAWKNKDGKSLDEIKRASEQSDDADS